MITWQIKVFISLLSQGLWISNLGGYWLFFGCSNRSLRMRKLDNPIVSLLLSFIVKKVYYIKCWRSRRDTTESLCLPKTNTKMPTRTKSAEINKILTNSEIRLHHCFCESSCFKTGRNSHRRYSIKKLFLKILQNWQENICVRVRHRFFPVIFTKFFKTRFLQNTSGQLLLMNRLNGQIF